MLLSHGAQLAAGGAGKLRLDLDGVSYCIFQARPAGSAPPLTVASVRGVREP